MADVISNTPYDDAFKTMYVKCDELVFPMLNELFGEHYNGTEKIVRHGNEHFIIQDNGAESRLFSDSFLEVIGENTKKYHCECESGSDGSIIVRMFQYGSQMAVENAVINENVLNVQFPSAGILFLRDRSKTPDDFYINITVPGDMSVKYHVPTIKISSYDINDIFKKKLYFLIPFYIFNFEKSLEKCETDLNSLYDLEQIYIDIFKRLETEYVLGNIQTVTAGTLKDLTSKVIQNLAYKYSRVRKGMSDIMGGHVLDLDIFKYRDEGLAEGRIEGRIEGRNEIIHNMLNDGRSPEEISMITKIDLEIVRLEASKV